MRCLCPLIAVSAFAFGSQFAQAGKKDCCAPTNCAPQAQCCQFPLSYIDALNRAKDADKAEALVAQLQAEKAELNEQIAELKTQRDAAVAQARAAQDQAAESATAARAARDETAKAHEALKAAEEQRKKADDARTQAEANAAVAVKNQKAAEAAAKVAVEAAEVARVAELKAKVEAYQKGKQILELQAQLDDAKGKPRDENAPLKAQQPAKLEDQPTVEEEPKSE